MSEIPAEKIEFSIERYERSVLIKARFYQKGTLAASAGRAVRLPEELWDGQPCLADMLDELQALTDRVRSITVQGRFW